MMVLFASFDNTLVQDQLVWQPPGSCWATLSPRSRSFLGRRAGQSLATSFPSSSRCCDGASFCGCRDVGFENAVSWRADFLWGIFKTTSRFLRKISWITIRCVLKWSFVHKYLMKPNLIYIGLERWQSPVNPSPPRSPPCTATTQRAPRGDKSSLIIVKQSFMSPGIQRSKPQTRDRHCPYWLWGIVWVQTASRNPGIHCQVG